MQPFTVTLLALGLVLTGGSALAQDGQTSFTLESHTESYGGYFTLEGQTTRNPTLMVPPDTEVTITLVGMDEGVHNVQVEGNPASSFVTREGETVTYTFTSPASGTVQYWCVPHRDLGMVGEVAVQAGAAPDGTGGTPSTPTPPTGEETPATPTGTGTSTDEESSSGGSGGNGTPGFGTILVATGILGAALLARRRE